MRVLGIDPGTWATGYGLLSAESSVTALDWGAVSFKKGTPLEHRLHRIYLALSDIIDLGQPQELAVEDPFLGRGHHTYPAPAIALGQAQAAALMAAARHNVPVFRYSPAEVKLAVADYGRASKEQVQELLARQLGLELPFAVADAADALAVALCHLRRRQSDDALQGRVSSGWLGGRA